MTKQSIVDQVMSYKPDVQAFGSGFVQGINDFGSSIQKLNADVNQAVGFNTQWVTSPTVAMGNYLANTPQQTSPQIQQQYEQNLNNYNNNPNNIAHPYLSGAGRLAGNMTPQIAAMAATGGASTPSLFGTLARQVPISAASGGLFNQPGQQEAFNTDNAIKSGLMSIPLSAAGSLASNYLSKIGQQSVNSIKELTGTSAVNAVDNTTGMVNTAQLAQSAVDPEHSAILSGLGTLFKHLGKDVGIPAAIGSAVGGAIGGSDGAKIGAIGVPLAWASPSAVRRVLSYSPLKNTLLSLNKLGNSLTDNPQLATYIAQKAVGQIANAGIDLNLQDQNKVSMIMKPDVNASDPMAKYTTEDWNKYFNDKKPVSQAEQIDNSASTDTNTTEKQPKKSIIDQVQSYTPGLKYDPSWDLYGTKSTGQYNGQQMQNINNNQPNKPWNIYG